MHPHKIAHTFLTLSASLSVALSFGVFVGATSFTALAAHMDTNSGTSIGSKISSNTNTTNIVVTAPVQPATLPDTVAFRRGDANIDGKVDLSDSVAINEYVASRATLACKDAADVDNDGSVSTADSSALLSYLFKGGSAPAAPGPTTPGLDTGADALGCASYSPPAPTGSLGDLVNQGLDYDTVVPYQTTPTTNANANVSVAPTPTVNANTNTNSATNPSPTLPDLTVTSIQFISPSQIAGESGSIRVTIKNLGGPLNSGRGLLNQYNNFTTQGFQFENATFGILGFQMDRAVPDPSKNNPLLTGESITFSWAGKFSTAGTKELTFRVDNANELSEAIESNNNLTRTITISTASTSGGRVIRTPGTEDRELNEYWYYVGADNKRYVFAAKLDEGYSYDTFSTWYASANEVITVSQAELESTALGGNVTMRPGSRLVGISTDTRVYVINGPGVLQTISEAAVLRLYGPNWQVQSFTYVPDHYFVNYIFAGDYVGTRHPDGTLIQYTGERAVYLVDQGQLRFILGSLADYGYRASDVVTVSRGAFDYPDGAPLIRREARLHTPAGPIGSDEPLDKAGFRRGDANVDGKVDLSDPVRIGNFIQGSDALACLDAADANDDGAVNALDRTALLDWLYQGGRAPAEPGPFLVGADPTADSLGCGSSPNLGGLMASGVRFVRGDANGDGKVDQSDAVAVSTHLNLGTALRCLDAADANDDGFVTAKDVAAIESALFSAPNPSIGVLGPDETVESLGCASYTANANAAPTPAVSANTNMAASQPQTTLTVNANANANQAVALPAPRLNTLETKVAFRRGDANGDGTVDVSDAITVNTGISAPATLACHDAADANDDGVISVDDSLALLAYLFEGGAPPAAPGPSTPGVDPTDDAYGCAAYGGVAGTIGESDTDRDGLADFEERLRGTSLTLVDTDADGFSDAEEVRSGYNPLVAGSAAVSTPAQRLSFYGKSRLPNVKLEAESAAKLRAEVAKILNRPARSIRLHPTLVNARLYGGYRLEEVALVVKYGPAKAKFIHPKIEAAAWRTTPGYQGSAAQFLAAFTRGDVNGDGQVDISDISVLGLYFAGKAKLTCLDAADVNDDGRVDLSDLKRLTDYYSNGGAAPAAPAPGTVGADPTPDGLFCGR